jgi:two-component system phosphate regulon sensor histidine kinase PhoR
LRTPTDISIIVRDDGQGIPTEYLPRLFTRFFRAPTKESLTIGTGLGLTICKHIVEAHHGKLEVISEVNKGSAFTVRLPVLHEDEFIPIE